MTPSVRNPQQSHQSSVSRRGAPHPDHSSRRVPEHSSRREEDFHELSGQVSELIETKHLELRRFDTTADSTQLLAALRQPGTYRYIDEPIPMDDQSARRYLAARLTGLTWTIRLKSTGELLGFSQLGRIVSGMVEVGIVLGSASHGRGYGREALKATIEYAFSRADVRTVHAGAKTGNVAIRRLVESLGFSERGKVEAIGRNDEIGYILYPVRYFEATGWEPPPQPRPVGST